MKTVIGFNIVCFAICSLIVMLMYDGTLKEKIVFIIGETIFMGLLSLGIWLMNS